MGTQLRHFKALNRKNWINWKRTLAGSCMELICPLILLSFLAFFRWRIPRETIDNIDLGTLRHGLYPMARWNSVSKNYTLASSFPVNDMNK